MTVEIFAPRKAAKTGVEDLDHLACCCDFATAFCGTDITAAEWVAEEKEWRMCVVCVDLHEHFQEISVCCPNDPDVRRG